MVLILQSEQRIMVKMDRPLGYSYRSTCSNSRPAGNLNLVVVGSDGGIWHKSKPSGGSWSAWDSAGGATTATPGVVQLGTEVVVVVTGTDNAVWFNQFGTGWQGWKTLGGTAFSSPSLSTTG
jgi:hypothetical protein